MIYNLSSIELNKCTLKEFDSNEVIDITTKLTPSEAFRAINRKLETSRYSIDDIDVENNSMILSERVSLISGGYFIGILCKFDEKDTKIKIGIKSKNAFVGFGNKVHLERFINFVRSALLIFE